MEYNFREIEKKWQEYWIANGVYKVKENKDKPKYYVLICSLTHPVQDYM